MSLPSQAHAHSTHNATLLPLICHLCASQQKTFLQDGTGHRKLWDLQGLRLHHLQVRSWTCPHAKSHAYLWLVLHASGVRASAHGRVHRAVILNRVTFWGNLALRLGRVVVVSAPCDSAAGCSTWSMVPSFCTSTAAAGLIAQRSFETFIRTHHTLSQVPPSQI